jgi:hypothetical protein
MNKKFTFLIIFIFIFSPLILKASTLSEKLAGRILLQVEENGEAWYVSPYNQKRYFLSRTDEAFSIMRQKGIGITNDDLLKIPVSLDYLSGKDSNGDGLPDVFKEALGLDINSSDSDGDGFDDYSEILYGYNPLGPGKLAIDEEFAKNQAGKIFLQVEQNGEAWYISPENNKRYFLSRPTDAFNIMRNLGLGISNENLKKIEIYNIDDNLITQVFNWYYNSKDYFLEYKFKQTIFDIYNQNDKLLYYNTNEKPEDIREAYYQIFFEINENDTDTLGLLDELISLANSENYYGDEKVEFILSFIQYIPYDYQKAESENPKANFPFETLYLNTGVCTDTSFLAIMWLKELSYGTAIFDFPDTNHAALAIKCPPELSLNQSGFCCVETTNYFPFGVVPNTLSAGLALSDEQINHPFSSENLGTKEIRLINEGKSYQKISVIKEKVEEINLMKQQIDEYLRQIEEGVENQAGIINNYNELVEEYNRELKLFYHIF